MIRAVEINPKNHVLNTHQWENFYRLYFAINEFRVVYDKPMIVTSGVRSLKEHQEIYERLKRPAPHSAHLTGGACDFEDFEHAIYNWAFDHEPILISLGLYLEHKDYTPTWCHMQIVPTRRRFFIPF